MTTRSLARLLDCTVPTLCRLVSNGRIDPPARNDYGYYDWSEADIQAARHALANPRKRGPHTTAATRKGVAS
jgi:DNA-binding transcriptional MerR regulator